MKPVHPHVCGEHCKCTHLSTKRCGSSPRVWGTCRCGLFGAVIRRFIPTCVGNILSPMLPLPCRAVHPHVCGEHGYLDCTDPSIDGSSPRVWGTSQARPGLDRPLRFIPTCVGNITVPVHSFAPLSVHPHVCGEHYFFHYRTAANAGSSPRVWGTYIRGN